MRFFEIVVSGAALLSSAFAVEINDYPTGGIVAGQTYTITYSPKDQTPTTFVLRRGPSTNLDTVATIGTATGGSFTWTVPKDLANAPNYAFEVKQDGQAPNYSGQFPLTGGSGSVSSAVSSASAALSSAASALSSARSAASSVASSAASLTSPAASASISPSAGLNSTVSSATLSRTSAVSTSRATGSPTGSSAPPQTTGAAASLSSSPLALIFGAAAAFAYLY